MVQMIQARGRDQPEIVQKQDGDCTGQPLKPSPKAVPNEPQKRSWRFKKSLPKW